MITEGADGAGGEEDGVEVVMEEAADKEAEGVGEAVVGDGEVAEVSGGHGEGGVGGFGEG